MGPAQSQGKKPTFLPAHRRQVFGVDFSGAADAGRRIWIAQGAVDGRGLRITGCYQGETLPGSGRARARCLAALRHFIARQPTGIFGFDFPFGLPQPLVKEATWEGFLLSFRRHYADPEHLREACRAMAHGRELRRATDQDSHTPFSPYNLRLYRQTFFGLGDLLAPLVRDHRACVLPLQQAVPGRPWLVEVCPATNLKQANLYTPYKGKRPDRREARRRILLWLERAVPVCISSPHVRRSVLNNDAGDAIDSVLAAFAAFRALSSPSLRFTTPRGPAAIEGYVYA